MSRKFKSEGKGTRVCEVASLLMTGCRTRRGIAVLLGADPDSVSDTLELLRLNGLAYKSHFDISRRPKIDGKHQRGHFPVVWKWNTIPYEYTDFRGPASNQKGEVNANGSTQTETAERKAQAASRNG